ncbi:unnamed protein product [Closterium sp. NIES-65]|nr:unnamed protein product [Closterium sp. NIES-65]
MLEIGVGIGGVAKFPDAARIGVGGPLLLDLTAEFPPGRFVAVSKISGPRRRLRVRSPSCAPTQRLRRAGNIRLVADRQWRVVTGRRATVRSVTPSLGRLGSRDHRTHHVHRAARHPGADLRTGGRVVTVRPVAKPHTIDRLLRTCLARGPHLRVRRGRQSASGSTLLVTGADPLFASANASHLASSRPLTRMQVDVGVVGSGEGMDAAKLRVKRRPGLSAFSEAGAGFVGAGGGDPWAAYAPLRPRSPPRDLAVSSRRTRAAAVLPPMKEVPTVTLARLWSLAESLQSLELILLESHGSMAVTPPSTFSQMPRARCHAAA